MPHDRNGVLLKENDTVTITGVVTKLVPGTDTCNCELRVDGLSWPMLVTASIVELDPSNRKELAR